MSDVIFVAATLVFFDICALYVQWCDKIIGPDDFKSSSEATVDAPDEEATGAVATAVGTHREVRT